MFAGSLDALSPLKVLQRGYAVATNDDGQVLRSVKDFAPGIHFSLKLSDGVARAEVLTGKDG